MTNQNTLLYNIMKFIRDGHIAFRDLRIFQSFVWAIVGVFESKKPHLCLILDVATVYLVSKAWLLFLVSD